MKLNWKVRRKVYTFVDVDYLALTVDLQLLNRRNFQVVLQQFLDPSYHALIELLWYRMLLDADHMAIKVSNLF